MKKNDGNALLIVLIGIALFAALMFTLTRNRSTTNGVETAALMAQEITSFADKVNGAVQNVMLQNGCGEADLSFENNVVNGYANAGAPAKCKIFDPAGGGLSLAVPPPDAVDAASAAAAGSGLAGNYLFESNACVNGVGTGSGSCNSSQGDLLFIMPWVTESVCEQIDQIALGTTSIPSDSGTSFNGTKFTGSFSGTYVVDTGTATQSACYKSSASPPGAGYHYYYVLLAR